MHDAIHGTVHGASDLMAWMQDNAYLLAKNGCPVSWVTPAGLVVTQAYWAPKSRVLRTLMGETRVRRSVRYAEPGSSKLQVRKQVSSIVPNVIHSFDAAHMMMTVVGAECSAFAVVHDSFGTHAADMPAFLKVIREKFIEIYSREVAQDLQRDFEASRGTADFPLVPPPAVGDFDINQVLCSPFFFA
jgi:DNA-directed RNA polymerase